MNSLVFLSFSSWSRRCRGKFIRYQGTAEGLLHSLRVLWVLLGLMAMLLGNLASGMGAPMSSSCLWHWALCAPPLLLLPDPRHLPPFRPFNVSKGTSISGLASLFLTLKTYLFYLPNLNFPSNKINILLCSIYAYMFLFQHKSSRW